MSQENRKKKSQRNKNEIMGRQSKYKDNLTLIQMREIKQKRRKTYWGLKGWN